MTVLSKKILSGLDFGFPSIGIIDGRQARQGIEIFCLRALVAGRQQYINSVSLDGVAESSIPLSHNFLSADLQFLLKEEIQPEK